MEHPVVSSKLPRRDARLTLALLNAIATSTENDQPVKSSVLEMLPGWSPQQVKRELKLLREEEQIDYINMSSFDHPGAVLVKSLSPGGWVRLEELQERYRRPARWIMRKSWPAAERWLFGLGVPVALALVGWLVFG